MGVDTGSVEADVKYASDSTQNVTIRTAGGALTVNAKNATVSHYGTAQSVDVQEVAEESYHEYEKVTGNLTITKGHVVFESTAVVNTFVVAGDATTVKATVNDKAQVLTAVAKDKNILTDLNLPATVETVVAEMDDLAMFAGGAGTEKSPYQIATAEQFKNIGTFSDAMKTKAFSFVLINDIDLTETDFSNGYVSEMFYGTLDGNNYSITTSSNISFLFKYANLVCTFKDYTIQLTDGLTRTNYMSAFTSLKTENGAYIVPDDTKISISYINVDYKGETGVKYNLGGDNAAIYFTNNHAYFWDITTNDEIAHELINLESAPQYAAKQPAYMPLHDGLIEGCDVELDLVDTGTRSAVFSGGQNYFFNLTIKDSSYKGTFQASQGGALLYANYSGYGNGDVFEYAGAYKECWGKMENENVRLEGQIVCLTSTASMSFANNTKELSGIVKTGEFLILEKDATLGISLEGNDYVISAATNANTEKYRVQLKLGTLYWYRDNTYSEKYAETSDFGLNILVSKEDISSTGIKKSRAISLKEAIAQGIVANGNQCTNVSEEGYKYCFVESSSYYYLVIDFEGAGLYQKFDGSFDRLGIKFRANVYALDADNTAIAYSSFGTN